jgi:hypothetical protein
MKSIEEILWAYIDGQCTTEEEQVIRSLIAEDESYRLKYNELSALNADLGKLELDEPPMAFSYKVMEAIRAENPLVPLKAAINKRIIAGIGLFFTITILVLLVYVLSQFKWSTGGGSANLSLNFKMPDINYTKAKPVVQAFVFFDAVLGLYLLDAFLRKKRVAKQN